jgi:hypothetical protein
MRWHGHFIKSIINKDHKRKYAKRVGLPARVAEAVRAAVSAAFTKIAV